jgi:polyhydroxybutyrate depolymerase
MPVAYWRAAPLAISALFAINALLASCGAEDGATGRGNMQGTFPATAGAGGAGGGMVAIGAGSPASVAGSGPVAGIGLGGMAAIGAGGVTAAGSGGAAAASGGGGTSSDGTGGASGMAGASGGAAGAGGPPTMSTGCGASGAMTGAFQAEIMAADLMRGYFLSVPAGYDASKPHRLVFGYHGSNYTGRMMRQYLDNEKAPLLENTIFVYPDGLPLPNQPSNVAWVLTDGGRDLVFFDTLLDHLKRTYCIDESRIFVNGQSFGGLMTNAVGCLRGDVIRAIAVVAGSGPRGGTCKEQVAVWMTHGTEDMNVSFSSGEASRDRWIAANHCMNMTEPGTPMQCQNYVGCDAGHPVIWCPHTDDGGHQHPSFGRAAVRVFLASF